MANKGGRAKGLKKNNKHEHKQLLPNKTRKPKHHVQPLQNNHLIQQTMPLGTWAFLLNLKHRHMPL
jgi:hypothetical protein